MEHPLLPEGKMVVVVKDPALLNLQDQLQDPIQGPLPDQQITDETRAQKETTKAPCDFIRFSVKKLHKGMKIFTAIRCSEVREN